MTKLDEPTDPCSDGPVRARLRELRGQIDHVWAHLVDKARLVTAGVYQAVPSAGEWNYLRFDPDGTVVMIDSSETPQEVWQQLNAGGDPGITCRTKYTLRAVELSFMVPFRPSVELAQEWQGLRKRLCDSYQPDEALVRELKELESCPQDRSSYKEIQEQIERLERLLSEHRSEYGPRLDESMNRLHYSGTIGRRTMRLKWRSDFTDTYSGLTTYWLAFATEPVPRGRSARPSEKPGERMPKVGPVRAERP